MYIAPSASSFIPKNNNDTKVIRPMVKIAAVSLFCWLARPRKFKVEIFLRRRIHGARRSPNRRSGMGPRVVRQVLKILYQTCVCRPVADFLHDLAPVTDSHWRISSRLAPCAPRGVTELCVAPTNYTAADRNASNELWSFRNFYIGTKKKGGNE